MSPQPSLSSAVKVPVQEKKKGLISFTVDKDVDVGGEEMSLWSSVERQSEWKPNMFHSTRKKSR